MNSPQVYCFGELLWDCLPAGLFLGGAPMNVAAQLSRLGVRSGMISAVGEDFLGREALERVRRHGVDTHFIATEPSAPTGTVQAVVGPDGSATYTIRENVAWDYIPVLLGLEELLASAKAIVFGSLALRGEFNRTTLDRLLQIEGPLKIFDVNLRPPHYWADSVIQLAKRADILKCNEDEARELTGRFDADAPELLHALAQKTGTARICLTRGAQGAAYLSPNGIMEAKSPDIKVRDTIGAGDAFLAALVAGILADKESDPDFLPSCCRLGAFVASREGALPEGTSKAIKGKGVVEDD